MAKKKQQQPPDKYKLIEEVRAVDFLDPNSGYVRRINRLQWGPTTKEEIEEILATGHHILWNEGMMGRL